MILYVNRLDSTCVLNIVCNNKIRHSDNGKFNWMHGGAGLRKTLTACLLLVDRRTGFCQRLLVQRRTGLRQRTSSHTLRFLFLSLSLFLSFSLSLILSFSLSPFLLFLLFLSFSLSLFLSFSISLLPSFPLPTCSGSSHGMLAAPFQAAAQQLRLAQEPVP